MRDLAMNFIFSVLLKRAIPRETFHLLFFPGIGCTQRIFKKIAQQVAKKCLDQEIIFHDEHPRCPEGFRQLIGKEKAIAVGHSLGGINAAMTVGAAPELFKGLVLCNTRYRQLTPLEHQAKQAVIKKISRCTEEEFDKLICRTFFRNQEESLTEEAMSLLIKEARSTGRQDFLQQINISLEEIYPNYSEILKRVPIQVIEGIDDKIIPYPGWEESGLQGAETQYSLELLKYPGGHLSVVTHPELIVSQISKMITAGNNPVHQELFKKNN
jgi:pimeloyl-ACP methyl ester carboxylesterase